MGKVPGPTEPAFMCMTNEGPDFGYWASLPHIHTLPPETGSVGCWDQARYSESPASMMWFGILMNV